MCRNLGYSTVKTVKIYDPLLATLHYAFMGGIFVYIVVFLVVRDLGYCAFEEPIGTARVSIQPPTVGTPDSPTFDPDDPGYQFDFVPASALPYCSEFRGAKPPPASAPLSQLDCLYQGGLETTFPVTGGSPFFVTTRVTESNQTLVCTEPNAGNNYSCPETYVYACGASFDLPAAPGNCPPKPGVQCWGWDTKTPKQCWAQRKYFVANVEAYTLLVDHAVRSPSIDLAADSSEMTGHLELCNGSVVVPQTTSQGQAFFTVADLLAGAKLEDQSCGLDLDTGSVMGPDAYSSARYDGIVLQLEINYQNTRQWSGPLATGKVEYTTRPSIVNGTKSKVHEQIWEDYPQQRVTRDRHGIKIDIIQSGRLGAFSFASLVTTLTGALGMLAVSTTLVDVLALYVLARKKLYREAKYDLVNEQTLDAKERQAALDEIRGDGWGDEYDDMPGGVGGDLAARMGRATSEDAYGALVQPAGSRGGGDYHPPRPPQQVDDFKW